jgi:hypothetical protein
VVGPHAITEAGEDYRRYAKRDRWRYGDAEEVAKGMPSVTEGEVAVMRRFWKICQA